MTSIFCIWGTRTAWRKFTSAGIAAACALASASALGDQVYVEQATGSGTSYSDLSAATELIRSSVPEVSGDQVTDQPVSADYALRPKLIRLGEAYVLSLSKVKNNQVIFSSQLKAARMDELDKVAQRLTRSVLLGERAKDNPRVGEITDQEARDGTQRRPSRAAWYLGVGGATMGNLSASGVGYDLGLAYAWDLNRVLLKIQGEAAVNGSAVFGSASLGGNYFLTLTDIAPYLAADFGLGTAKIDGGNAFSGQTVGGFLAGGGGGVQLLRTSSVNVDLGIHAQFLLHSNNLGTPSLVSFRLGLYF